MIVMNFIIVRLLLVLVIIVNTLRCLGSSTCFVLWRLQAHGDRIS
jgi:hypothetical protein